MANEFKVKNGLIVSGSADFEQDLRVRGTLTVDELHTSITTSSIIYESGSTRFGNSSDDIHTFTGSMNITGSISLNGDAIGTGKLDETTFNTYTSSYKVATADFNGLTGSYNSFTTSYISDSSSFNTRIGDLESFSSSLDTSFVNEIEFGNFSSSIKDFTSSVNSFTSSINTTIKDKLNNDGVISGSSQILNGSNIVSSSAQVTTYGFAITGSNTFKGDQYLSGSIIPTIDNAFDLGSPQYQWRDVYISSGSLYIDNTKVLSSTAQELTITTDTGQSIKILEGTTDSIILQTADGDVELKSSGDGDILLDPTNGKIMLKGPVEILNGSKIQSSVGGTPVVFANDIVVSGSIDITGTIEGINLTDLSSSINIRLGNLESTSGNLNSFTASAINRLNALETSSGSLNTYTSSNNNRLNAVETSTASLNSFTSSTNSRLSDLETATGSIISVNTTQNSRLDSLETTSGSILSTNTTQNGRLDSIEGKTGSYATTGSNVFIGNQTITGSLFISQDLIIAGSSSIQHISSSVVNIADNIITVNAQNPSIRFGGLAVIDSGSSPQVSGSMLFDSTNDQWIFVHQNQSTVTSSILLMGPQTYNNLGSESYPTTNRILKSVNAEHVGDSNISDNGTTVTILSNAIVNGTFSATGTTLVSGSSQINHNSTTNYDANQHVDHTAVSITAGNGLSGGGTIASTRTLTLDTGSVHFLDGVKKELNTEGVVSGSSQVSYTGLSNIPSGIVSGSSQVSYTGLSNIPSGIVSGSSQISFGGISGIPGGIVSGSAQIDLTATTNYSSGIKTRLNAEGVVSGSSQISFGSISSIPSGLVSGSSQITLSSTTGYGSVLNQAVLTSSSPTFAGLTLGTEFTSNDTNGYSRFTESNGSAQVGLFRSGTSSGGVYIGGDSDFFRIYTANFGSVLMSVSQSTGAISGATFTGAGTGLTGTASSLSIGGNAATVTNGVYTTGNQTIGGTKTFSALPIISVAGFAGIEYYNATSQWQGYIGTENNTGNLRYNSFSGAHTWYANSTQTMALSSAGRLSLSGSNSGSDPLVNLTATGTGTFQRGVRLLNSGMNAGDHIMMAVGQADSARNMGQFYFQYNGAGSTSNRISMGLHSVDDVFNIWGNGNVEIGGTSNGGYKLDVVGQIRSTAASALVVSMSSNAANDAIIAARWTSGTGMEMRYHPNSAVGYIQNTYEATSGQEFGDIHIRQNVGGTMTTRMLFKANNGFVGLGATPTQRLHVNGFVRANGLSVNETGGTISAFIGYEKGWLGSGSSNSLAIAAEGGNTVKFFTDGSTIERVRVANDGLRLNPNSTAYASYLWVNREINNDGGILMSKNSTLDWQINNTGSSGDLVIYSYGVGQTIMQIERANGNMTYRGNIVPQSNGTNNLGSSSLRWNTVFTSDLSMSNGIGDYTIVEGEEDLFIYNNKTSKVFKFLLQEVDPTIVPPKKV